MTTKIDQLKSNLLFLFTLIFVSPFFEFIHITVPMRCIFMLISIGYIEIQAQTRVNMRLLIGALIILLLSSVVAIHYKNLDCLFFLFNTIVFLIFLSFFDDRIISTFIDKATLFLFILEIGAIIGFLYVYLGGEPIFSFPNPDGRINYVFPITFSNVYLGKIIRPSGIYDEPGAFSFFIVCISILRLYFKKDSKKTIILLFLGLITFSLAHIITLIILMPPILIDLEKKQRIKVFCIFLIFFIIIYFLFFDVLNRLVFIRLTYNKDLNGFQGDTRSAQIPNTLQLLKDNGILWGTFSMSKEYIKSHYGVISENPFSQLARFGFFMSLPYYSFLLICVIAFFVTKKFLYLAIIGLFVQRPYSHLFGYATFFIIFYEMVLGDIYTKICSMKYLKR